MMTGAMMARIEAATYANPSGIRGALRAGLAMLIPPPDMSVSEWAEINVRIPTGNAIPGPYRVANAPYQREPMDQFTNPDCFRVTLKWGAQVGKTLTLLCIQGYAIDMRPRSQMMMQPSQGDVQTWLETKFNPLVESSPSIRRRIAPARGREGVNNQRMKSYPGGFLMLAWAGSPKTMRGRSAPFIGCDEVDGYERTDEGHPVGLLWQRSATFGDDRFLFEISTPTVKGESYIDDSWEAGDQRRFFVCCPHCQEAQALRWENVSWVGRVSEDADDWEADQQDMDAHRPETAAYRCEACSGTWNDGQRVAAIRNAEAQGAGWRAAKPFNGHASYHLWEAYSCFRKLGDIVRDYLDKLRTDDIQTFVNVSLSEVYEIGGETLDPDSLEARAAEFVAPVPAGGLYLTAGVDMQIDRLEVEVVAWGAGEQSWSVDYRVLWGDPLAGDVWDDLDELLATTYEHESGLRMPIRAACLDTGGTSGYTQCAYEYLRGKSGRRLFGIKGVGGFGRPIVEKMQRRQSGKKGRKIDLFVVGVDEAKLTVMRRLGIQAPGPGYCHIPSNDGRDLPEWCRQITAEKLVTHYRRGQPVRSWHKADKAPNEALDCRAYAYAALKIMRPSFRREQRRLDARIAAQAGEPPQVAAPAVDQSPAAAPPRKPRAPAEQAPRKREQRKPAAVAIEQRPRRRETGRVKRPPAPRRGGWVNGWK